MCNFSSWLRCYPANNENHQAALDGIRGFAALSVVLFHVGHWLDAPLASNSFLAVDLFFLLSGYVLTLAYARRLDSGLTVGRFIVLRLIRLMPLVVLGTLISAAYAIAHVYFKHDDVPVSALTTEILLGVFNIPYLTAPLSVGGNQIFPLNGPQFSLFLEIAVNVVWACAAFLRRTWLAAVFAILSFALIVEMG